MTDQSHGSVQLTKPNLTRWPMEPKEPSLKAALARASRARSHIYQLHLLNEKVCRTFNDALSRVLLDGCRSKRTTVEEFNKLIDTPLPEHVADVPSGVSMLVGEITYNLRASLDYLTCQLSKLDSPSFAKPRRNQFPIESTKQGFEVRRNSFLAGVNDAHAAAIARYQPFNSCEWISLLADLSNVDKHNDLIELRHGFTLKVRKPRRKQPAKFIFDDFVLVMNVAKHADLVDTLEGLADRVDALVNEFINEFPYDVRRCKANRERFLKALGNRPFIPQRGGGGRSGQAAPR